MSDNVHYDDVTTGSRIPQHDERPELFSLPPKGDAWARRTRVLALDAAARVASAIMSPSHFNGMSYHANPEDAASSTIQIARFFEDYLDGKSAT